ncbi:hypothetical protein [Iningainema tapete]|uniref:Uncharacterized protein n=1 Tax=Iningainema tapete BLCC-T55 TaxID=2748662 RepID=A0A8J6XB43_9CYAN|nr:hypothetical protein [Iningainema tapete]MBD2771800.1 hypothetical protein [Iningainema tapete BLCC-T55]
MIDIQTTFEIPDWIVQGLERGEYVRIGGVIRDAKTKHIVAMLREIAPELAQASTLLTQAGSIASLLNLGVSILNLAVSVIGFALILKRLKEIEQGLEKNLNEIQGNINHLHRKFDISVYANFRAALDLARDATTMLQPEKRINSATLAINRFLEAQHIYSNYVDISLKENLNIAEPYLLSLLLTYVARTRCYLELEEIKTAVFCVQEGAEFLRPRVKQYIKALLLSEPIARVIPKTIGHNFVILDVETILDSPIELCRLTRICKWLEPELNSILDDNSILFEAQGKNLVKFIQDKTNTAGFDAKEFLLDLVPIAAVSALPVFGKFIAARAAETVIQKKFEQQVYNSYTQEEINPTKLIKIVENIEQIIETYNRFETYLAEVKVIQQLGISFQNWLQLAPLTKVQQYEVESIYIIPSQPLNLK